MKVLSVRDAKTNLSKYIAAAKQGERIYIGRNATPEVMLTVASFPTKDGRRSFSKGKGKVQPADDAFSADMGKNNPAATIPSEWRGANLLGFALMEARAILSAD